MSNKGNFVAEWFGHRVYPEVLPNGPGLADQAAGRCPFLSTATAEERTCVKTAASRGVCTISSTSNGPRQDWLVCPYRSLQDSLLADIIDRIFGEAAGDPRIIAPAPTLASRTTQSRILKASEAGGRAIVYFQDKLGGEISLPKTDRSPELSFDVTLVEIRGSNGGLMIKRYGILEIQTMDFHGSYRYVVKNLQDALRLHRSNFHKALKENQDWLGERIEGPNIANVFKRTFYQMMLKLQIGAQKSCAGAVVALPSAVWDSWQRHLGAPDLIAGDNGVFELKMPGEEPTGSKPPAWIYVFDVDAKSSESPNPLVIEKVIATDSDSLAYYALKVAPQAAIGDQGSAGVLPERIKQRLAKWWPAFAALCQD